MTKVLASVPDHPRAHMYLGLVEIYTNRAAQGHRQMLNHALALDRNLAHAHNLTGLAKILYIGRAEETEAHVAEALRLSPRGDTMAYLWMNVAGMAKTPPRQLRAGGYVA